MENSLFIKNNYEKVKRNDYSNFLEPHEYKYVCSMLNKEHIKYNTFIPFPDATKYIVYKDKLPDISLIRMECKSTLEHKDILGTLFKHDILPHKYGDIIIDNNNYYLIVDNSIKKYIIYNMDKIGKYNVSFIEDDIRTIENYKYEYEEINILVSSLRLDNILSSLINTSRKTIDDLFNEKFIRINYQIVTKKTLFIHDNDIISIRKYGKFIFKGINKITSKNKFILCFYKYK